MREDTRKRLERAIWAERLRQAAIGLAIAAAIGLYIVYESYDLSVKNSQVAGVIEAIEPLVSKSNAGGEGLTVGVKLDDGRHVRVMELKSRDPHVGERITVVEHRHATGRVTHTLK